MLFVCGCFESELYVRVISSLFIPPILLKNFLKRKKTEQTNDYTLDQIGADKSVQGSIECVTVCHRDYSNFSQPVQLHCKLPSMS